MIFKGMQSCLSTSWESRNVLLQNVRNGIESKFQQGRKLGWKKTWLQNFMAHIPGMSCNLQNGPVYHTKNCRHLHIWQEEETDDDDEEEIGISKGKAWLKGKGISFLFVGPQNWTVLPHSTKVFGDVWWGEMALFLCGHTWFSFGNIDEIPNPMTCRPFLRNHAHFSFPCLPAGGCWLQSTATWLKPPFQAVGVTFYQGRPTKRGMKRIGGRQRRESRKPRLAFCFGGRTGSDMSKFIDFQWVVMTYTSSTAQGGGGRFKDRKPTGEFGCCGAWLAERTDGPKGGGSSASPSLLLSFSPSLSLAIYLAIYLSFISNYHYLSIYVKLPSKVIVGRSKTQQFCETLKKWKVTAPKRRNSVRLRPLHFRTWPHQKRSARLPSKMESWVQSWRPRTTAFFNFPTPPVQSIAPATKKGGQAIRSAGPVTQNHLSKPEDLMLQNATRALTS